MKRLILVAGLAVLLLSCDNGGMETNPYPDGVYPFEVANISHTLTDYFDFTITWDNPTDSGFENVYLELYYILGTAEYEESLVYSSTTGQLADLQMTSITLENNRLLFTTRSNGGGKYLIIKCVDKYGNISNGVKYEFSY